MTCDIQMLEEEVAAVHRYNDALAEELRACSAAVGLELPSTERDLAGVAGHVYARVTELEKVHSAACRHLEEQGPCDDTGDYDDEYHCGGECTYCDLNQLASAVDENTDQRGEGAS